MKDDDKLLYLDTYPDDEHMKIITDERGRRSVVS